MPRKQKLTPLENAILQEISEAGAEDLTVVLNSLLNPNPPSGGANDIGSFEKALRRLCSLELAALVWADLPGYPTIGAPQLEELLHLENWIQWEPVGGYWKRKDGTRNVAIAGV